MSAPTLLLVDDSDAILAFERAALCGDYAIATASNGQEALERMATLRPSAVVLDLSMPVMNGDEVLARMQVDEELRLIPVIVVSTEKQRAEACVDKGAAAYLPKPISADALKEVVARTLEKAARDERSGSMAILGVGVGNLELALPLDDVVLVVDQPALRPLPTGPAYLAHYVDFRGRPVCVLDLAVRLGEAHRVALADRKLVLLRTGDRELALSVDHVKDPEELMAADVVAGTQLGGSAHGSLAATLVAIVRTPRGQTPVLFPPALLSPELLEELPSTLAKLSALPETT